MSAENLPDELLRIIFEFAALGDRDDGLPNCPECQRPYYFRLVGRTASTIQAVSRRWRNVWRMYIVLKGMTAPDVPWCVSPSADALRYARHVRAAEEDFPPPWIYLPKTLANLLERKQ